MILSRMDARRLIRDSVKPYYCYVLHRPDGEPFYVGVGKGRRILDHENMLRAGVNRHKKNVIAKIRAHGGSVGYSIVGWHRTWADAGLQEREQIALYGRSDLGLGSLVNLTDGGEGTFGHTKSQEERSRLSALKKGKPLSEAHKAALRRAWAENRARRLEGAKKAAAKNRGRKASPETRAKLSAARKGEKRSDEWRAKISSSLKGRRLSAEHCAKMSELSKKRGISAALREGSNRWLSANAALLSGMRREIWNRPGYREQMSKALTGRKLSAAFSEGNRKRQIAKFQDAAFRARWESRHRMGLQAPEVKEKLRAATTMRWKDPEYRTRRRAETKALWQNPEFRARMIEARKQARFIKALRRAERT